MSTQTVSSNRRNEKGVHESMSRSDAGVSNAGAYISGNGYGDNMDKAKSMHKEKLKEMQSMPKPKLPIADKRELGALELILSNDRLMNAMDNVTAKAILHSLRKARVVS